MRRDSNTRLALPNDLAPRHVHTSPTRYDNFPKFQFHSSSGIQAAFARLYYHRQLRMLYTAVTLLDQRIQCSCNQKHSKRLIRIATLYFPSLLRVGEEHDMLIED